METPLDQFAEFTCVSCRRLKRKCSKDLPTCSLCSRVGRTCLYQPPSANPDQFDTQIENGFGQNLNGDATASASSTTPVLMTGFQPLPPSKKSPLAHSFLDSVATRGEEPALASSLLWQDLHPDAEPMTLEDAWITASRFFETTYDWLPIGECDMAITLLKMTVLMLSVTKYPRYDSSAFCRVMFPSP